MLIILNEDAEIEFNPDYALFIEHEYSTPKRILGTHYRKYIYPLREELINLNDTDYLFDKLNEIYMNTSVVNGKNFLRIVYKLVNLKFLSKFNVDQIIGYSTKDKLHLNVCIINTVPLFVVHTLMNQFKAHFILKTTVFCNYTESVKHDLQKLNITAPFDINFYSLNNVEEYLNVEKPDIIIDIGFHYGLDISRKLNEISCKNNILYLAMAIYNDQAIWGPLYINKSSLCINCAIKNDIIKKFWYNDNLLNYRNLYKANWMPIVFSMLAYELLRHYTNHQSCLYKSLLVFNALNNCSNLYSLNRIDNCKTCNILKIN